MPELTQDQLRALDVLDWLYDPMGNRRQGRTTIQAIALIRMALRNPGTVVAWEDHSEAFAGHHQGASIMENVILDFLLRDPDVLRAIEFRRGRMTYRGREVPNWLPPGWMVSPEPQNHLEPPLSVAHGLIGLGRPEPEPEVPALERKAFWDHIMEED